MPQVKFGSRAVGGGTPVYIVFEAGPTHTGLATALELAEHAKRAGSDAIKFQVADQERLISTPDVPFSYGVLVDRQAGTVETVTEPLIDIWRRRHMEREEWEQLFRHCMQLGIDVFATVFFEEDVDWLVQQGVCCLKIASQDVQHRDLIERVASAGVPIQLDTGNATIGEIERAVDWVRARGNEAVIINHCPSGYPARVDSIHLRMITSLKAIFDYPVAFSDHTPGWDMDVAAVGLGADMIEKTITLDRTIRSCEHMMSLEPAEMTDFVRAIRDVETALGERRRVLPPDVIEKRRSVMRSPYLVREMRAGECLARTDIEFRRPGYGLRPDSYHRFLGAPLLHDLEKGHMLRTSDFVREDS